MNKCFAILLLGFCCYTLGCSAPDRGSASINGRLGKALDKLEGEQLYLYDVGENEVVDSAVIKNHSFQFSITSQHLPFHASLKYYDTFQIPGKDSFIRYLRPMGFQNPYIAKTIESSFLIERGQQTIQPADPETRFLTITGGRQNIPYFKHIRLLAPADSGAVKRKQVLDYNKRLILQYPNSYALVAELDKIKDNLSKTEMDQLTSLFDKEMALGDRFTNYYAYRDSGRNMPSFAANIMLENEAGNASPLLERNASTKAKVLVFWASWCGPCRVEIPLLKTLYAKYKTSGVSLTSVSIDRNWQAWNKAVSEEKMPWKQLVVTENAEPRIDAVFHIEAIPIVFLFDRNDKLIGRFGNLMTDTVKDSFEKAINKELLR